MSRYCVPTSRPFRIEGSNAWYHVVNRRLRRDHVFLEREDRIAVDGLKACDSYRIVDRLD